MQAAVLVMVAALAAVIFTAFFLLLFLKDVLADHERPIVQGACVHVGIYHYSLHAVTGYYGTAAGTRTAALEAPSTGTVVVLPLMPGTDMSISMVR
jgi:hypothetical protein